MPDLKPLFWLKFSRTFLMSMTSPEVSITKAFVQQMVHEIAFFCSALSSGIGVAENCRNKKKDERPRFLSQ